jgi:hypothetical protein
LGQDRLTFTPAGGEGRITLGLAGELEGKVEETELSREVVKGQKDEMTYVKRKIRGKLELKNFSKKEAEVEVSRTVVGEVVSSTPQAKVTLISSDVLNPTNKLFWTVKVPAEGKIELLYEYLSVQASKGLPPVVPLGSEGGAQEGE